jgi:hypothetical protein
MNQTSMTLHGEWSLSSTPLAFASNLIKVEAVLADA